MVVYIYNSSNQETKPGGHEGYCHWKMSKYTQLLMLWYPLHIMDVVENTADLF